MIFYKAAEGGEFRVEGLDALCEAAASQMRSWTSIGRWLNSGNVECFGLVSRSRDSGSKKKRRVNKYHVCRTRDLDTALPGSLFMTVLEGTVPEESSTVA